MKNLRLKIMLFLYNSSSKIYAEVFKINKTAWNISKDEFLRFSDGSLGKALGEFYINNGFDVMPKLENHDVFHILTETDTTIESEIAMKYLLLGNGKLSLYLVAMLVIGGLLYPEHYKYYYKSFQKGKGYKQFYAIDYQYHLNDSVSFLQDCIRLNAVAKPII